MKNYLLPLLLLLFLITAGLPLAVSSQTLVEYDIRAIPAGGWTMQPAGIAAATVPANGSATNIVVHTGGASTLAHEGFYDDFASHMYVRNWTLAFNSDNYYEFTISADPGFELNMSQIQLGVSSERSGGFFGPGIWRLYSDITGFGQNDHIGEALTPSQVAQVVLTAALGASFDGISSVTFRLIGYGGDPAPNADGAGGISNVPHGEDGWTGTSSNVIISGTVASASTPPTVTTTTAAGITNTSAELGGSVTDPGSSAVSARGIVWGLASNPTIDDDNVVTMGSGTGVFDGTVPLLPMGTTIHVRAWATNDEETGYGSSLNFSTLANASVSLQAPEGWRMLASPVSTAYNSLLSSIWTQGVTGAHASFGSPNVFVWDNTSVDNQNTNWQVVGNLNSAITAGTGVLVNVFELDNFEDPNSDDWPKILTVSGAENAADVTPSVNSNVNGWTLLGNPFASHVSYNGLNPVNISNNTIYIWDVTAEDGDGGQDTGDVDPGAGSWKTWNNNSDTGDITGGVISPFQGFFVETGAAAPSITFSQSSKTTEEGAGFRGKETDDIYRIRLELTGRQMRNSAWLAFSHEGSFTQNDGDAWKLQPLSANYTLLAAQKEGGSLMDVAHFPNYIGSEEAIPLVTETTRPGTYTLTVSSYQLNGMPQLYLVDTRENLALPLTADFSYTFDLEHTAKAPASPFAVLRNEDLRKTADEPARFLITTDQNALPGGTETPQAFTLGQNYPNPFNPTTVISYELPEASRVRLEVFDMTGRQVATLVEGQITAGSHRVTFDGSNLSSGVYIYRLLADNTILTKKLTLIK